MVRPPEAALDGMTTGNRSRRSGHGGPTVDGPTTGEPLSVADAYTEVISNSQSSELLRQNARSLVNKGQHMLHKFSVDANSMSIFYWQV